MVAERRAMLPVVTEIVYVAETVSLCQAEIPQLHIVLVQQSKLAVFIILRIPEPRSVDLELVQVIVFPAEGILDHLMQARQGGLVRYEHPPPDRRADSLQFDPDLPSVPGGHIRVPGLHSFQGLARLSRGQPRLLLP